MKGRRDLLVLIGLGNGHTPVAGALQDKGYEIDTAIYGSYAGVNPEEQAIERQRDNGFVDDDLLAK